MFAKRRVGCKGLVAPDDRLALRHIGTILLTYVVVTIVGVAIVSLVLIGPSPSLPASLLTATGLSAPSSVAAACAAIVMQSRRIAPSMIAASSAITAGSVGAIVVGFVGLNRGRPDPDAFFDPTGPIVVGAIAGMAIVGLIAGAGVGRAAPRT